MQFGQSAILDFQKLDTDGFRFLTREWHDYNINLKGALLPAEPNVKLLKSCTSPADCVTNPQIPETDLTYKVDFTSDGGSSAASLIIVDGVPEETDFKIGSASVNTGTTGLTFVIEYSDDYDESNPTAATWTYIPVSEGGGADSGYDRNVKAVRWHVTSGTLSQTAPNNTGSVEFIAKIQ